MVSRIFDDLRHPLLDDLGELWEPVKVNAPSGLFTSEMIEEVPGLLPGIAGARDGERVSYVSGTREAALGLSPILYAKATEAASAGVELCDRGKWLAGIASFYLADYLMGKSILYLFGVVPVGRDRPITLDIFPVADGKRRGSIYTAQLQVWCTSRWSHSVVWGLLQRILRTVKAEPEVREHFRELRLIDWDRFSRRRNRYLYHDSFVCLENEIGLVCVPEDVSLDIKSMVSACDLRKGSMEAAFYYKALLGLKELHFAVAVAAEVCHLFDYACGESRHTQIAA